MKKYFTLFLLSLSVSVFAQKAEFMRALELNKDNKHAEAIVLFEQLLSKQYGPLDEITQTYCMALNAGNYYAQNNYKKAYEKYDEELKFLRTIKKEDDKNIKALVKFMEELKLKIPDFKTPSAVVQNTAEANSSSQAAPSDKVVTLTVNGSGKTVDEAKQSALRSAIEQAFGAFISSKTEVLNDSLVKDEIVSVSNGNIQKFEIVSEPQFYNDAYFITLKATVSIDKLTSFVESKGWQVEFKGAVFGANLRQQKMNENAEIKAILNLCEVSNEILSNSLDYTIVASEPKLEVQSKKYAVLLTVAASQNTNFKNFSDNFKKVAQSISMPTEEVKNYKALNKPVYSIIFPKIIDYREKVDTLSFRNPQTSTAIQNLFIKSNQYVHNFFVYTNIDTIPLRICCNVFRGLEDISPVDKTTIRHNINMNGYFGGWNLATGFPTFKLPGYYAKTDLQYWNSSGEIYLNYLKAMDNMGVFFDKELYFRATKEYYQNKQSNFGEYKIRNDQFLVFGYPGVPRNDGNIIGALIFDQIVYNSTFNALYSEEEISKITGFYVKRAK